MGLEARIREVKGPRPELSRDREHDLSPRQREILDELTGIFDEGFRHLTMADLAARVGCSLRTLYGLASSRDELVRVVVDRNLWWIGRAAMGAISSDMAPLDAISSYLRAATVAVANTTEAFAVDCELVEPTRQLQEGHSNYLIAVTRTLLDMAVEDGDIVDTEIDTAAVARVVAGLGRDLARPEVLPTLRTSPKEAADSMVGSSSRDSVTVEDPSPM